MVTYGNLWQYMITHQTRPPRLLVFTILHSDNISRAWQFSRPPFIASYLLLMAGIYYPLLELSPTWIGIASSNSNPPPSHFLAGQLDMAHSLLNIILAIWIWTPDAISW